MSDIPKKSKTTCLSTYNQPIVSKGNLGDLSVTMWDVCDECIPEDCPIAERCTYKKGGKCLVQSKYLDKVFAQIVQQNGEILNDALMTRFGFELIPLFGHLIKFKIAEMAMKSRVFFDEKGNIKINPVYREIREIIRTIGTVYRGIMDSVEKKADEGKYGRGQGDEEWIKNLLSPTEGFSDVEVAATKPRRRVKRGMKKELSHV